VDGLVKVKGTSDIAITALTSAGQRHIKVREGGREGGKEGRGGGVVKSEKVREGGREGGRKGWMV